MIFPVALAVAVVVVVVGRHPSSGTKPSGTTTLAARAPLESPSGHLSAAASPAAVNIYAHAGANMLAPSVRSMPYRIYVPDSAGTGVDVIDPSTYKAVAHYTTGLDPQHVVPAWNLQTLYATNDLDNSLTPISPYTGRPSGPNIPVADPYNMYFTPDGRHAIVVEEARQVLAFRDAHTLALQREVPVDCAGVDHIDFSADGSYLIATCEFSGKLVKVDLGNLSVVGYLQLGGSPQDIKLDPTGRTFYVADRFGGGVDLVDAATFTKVGFIPTGKDAHGLYPSRDATKLYVSNRGSGSVTVIDFATHAVVATWTIPGGGSPDMGGVSPDGQVLWLAGRYDDVVYAFSTIDGHLIAKIPVGAKPHGLSVWPQPGRYSLGHTGVTR